MMPEPSRNVLVYISGPITPTEYFPDAQVNRERFSNKAKELFTQGYSVYSPCEAWLEALDGYTLALSDDKYAELYQEILKMDERIIRSCDVIYLMKGWQHSKGATHERKCAIQLGLKVVEETT